MVSLKRMSKAPANRTKARHGRHTSGCAVAQIAQDPNLGLAGLVSAYLESQRPNQGLWNPLRSVLEGYANLPDLKTAVAHAAEALDLIGKSYHSGFAAKVKRHPHQRRIRRESIFLFKRHLLSSRSISRLRACQSFDEVYDFVALESAEIDGIGQLFVYDTSLRIGSFLGLLPETVYLHAGALMGARHLGFRSKLSPLSPKKLSKELRQMTAYEIEDFLCIYKEQIKRIQR
jgi:hypothetical protein